MEKAQEWAEKYCNHYNSVWPEKISFTPAIIGAVIDLGYSLNLTDYENFSTIRMGYDALLNKEWEQKYGISDNEHKLVYKSDADFIDRIHDYLTIKKMKQYDSVIAEYKAGKILCEKPQSKEGVETLICIRNPNCIKGYFKPSYQNFLYPSV